MIPTNNLRIRSIHVSTPHPRLNCTIVGCNRSFKNRSGIQSHIRAQHSNVSVHPAQPQLPNTPGTRAQLQPEMLLLSSPHCLTLSPLNSSDSEEFDMLSQSSPLSSSSETGSSTSKTESMSFHVDDEDNNIFMDIDQPASPSRSGSMRARMDHDDDGDPLPSPSPSWSGSMRAHVDDDLDDSDQLPSSPGSGNHARVTHEPLARLYHPVINGKNLYNVVFAILKLLYRQTLQQRWQ